MKILIEWTIPKSKWLEALELLSRIDVDEYKEQWGPGITTLGRWHNPATGKSLAVVEADDPVNVSRMIMGWGDLAEVEMSIVHTDEEAFELIAVAKELRDAAG